MKLKIIAIISVFIMMSCKNEKPCCVVLNTTVQFKYEDSLHNDLLNPLNTNAYDFSQMKHFCLDKQNVKKEVFYGNADSPKSISLFLGTDSIYSLSLFVETYKVPDGINTFYDYIQLNAADEDTIQSDIQVANNGSSVIIKKAWYNNQLVYNADDTARREIIILK